jgi:perosamine synthetase
MDFFHTHVSSKASDLVRATLESSFLSEGERVAEFELALERELGLANPVAVNSGTSALHLALVLAGVGPGDEVILPAQTFIATGMVVLMQRATPVFADIDPTTGNVSPASVRERVTDRTSAIVPVHWGGYPCDMDEIGALAHERGLAVVEDAAHALGATYRGRPVGAISRFTAFSFQAIKHLTTGDGGALCCADAQDAREARVRRWFGIDRANSRPSILGERASDVTAVGYKYHMNDLAASLGLANLTGATERLRRRQANGLLLRERLKGVPGLSLLRQEPDRTHAYWIFTILVERREDFIRALASRGVPSSVVHLRIDGHGVFRRYRRALPGQDRFDAAQVALPVHDALEPEDLGRVIDAVTSGW